MHGVRGSKVGTNGIRQVGSAPIFDTRFTPKTTINSGKSLETFCWLDLMGVEAFRITHNEYSSCTKRTGKPQRTVL